VGDYLYFFIDNLNSGYMELWRSDATAAGTILLQDEVNICGCPVELVGLNETAYFTVDDSDTGEELWKSDGTVAGTVLVKDIEPGTDSSYPYALTATDSMLYFVATTSATGEEIWKSDGTAVGTVQVIDLYQDPTATFDSNFVEPAGDQIFFTLYNDSTSSLDLWRSDGTESGTFALLEEVEFSFVPLPNFMSSAHKDHFFFTHTDTSNGIEIWSSDGTIAGTGLLADINLGPANSMPIQYYSFNDALYFMASDTQVGNELYRYGLDLSITSSAQANTKYGSAFSHTFKATNDAVTWTTSSTIPQGLQLNPQTGILSGTPTVTGEFTLDLQASTNKGTTASQSFKLTIAKAPLSITVNNATRQQGQANPNFTVSYTGFVNGDTAAKLSGALVFNTTATPSSPVGNYSISASGLSSDVYEISYANGLLTITSAPEPEPEDTEYRLFLSNILRQ
jgi:ELWxxDGT repeat protein